MRAVPAVFARIEGGDYEQVVFCQDRSSGLRAIVAVHSTRLGPALGGARFSAYTDEDEALDDALRLARAMTYKAALAGLDLGGGKAVILGHPATDKNEALLRAFGRHVDALGGRYVTAEDVGTSQADMDLLREETAHVTGTSPARGGSGDPSPATAEGLLWAMRAVSARLWGTTALTGSHVVIAGMGKVGTHLAEGLVREGASLTVADVVGARVDDAVERFGATPVPPEKAHAVECDVFSPCALGGALGPTTIGELRCQAVVGAANNQLADGTHAEALVDAGVLYAPDYAVNAGGLINIAEELRPGGWRPDRGRAAVARVFETTTRVLDLADAESVTPAAAADLLAERRLAAAAGTPWLRLRALSGGAS